MFTVVDGLCAYVQLLPCCNCGRSVFACYGFICVVECFCRNTDVVAIDPPRSNVIDRGCLLFFIKN